MWTLEVLEKEETFSLTGIILGPLTSIQFNVAGDGAGEKVPRIMGILFLVSSKCLSSDWLLLRFQGFRAVIGHA